MNDKRMKDALENIARRHIPENTNLWPKITGQIERKSLMMTLRTRPFVAILIALLVLFTLSGVVYALGRAFGYIPGIGLVENNDGMRVLAEPASVTRDGVTLTVTQVLVYADHVQLVYEVSGIAPENDSSTFTDPNSHGDAAYCGDMQPGGAPNSDGDAQLRLPDGTIINRVFGSDKYLENIFAMKPAYEVSIPQDVTELTLVLKCIPWTRLGAVPENWEVPLKLKSVPAGTVIGEPVLEVTPSVMSSAYENGVTVMLDKVVPQNDLYSFYVSIVPDEKKESLSALYPASAALIDSTGQKIALIYNHPFSGYQDTVEPWELQTVSKPANGPYTLLLDKLFAYHQEDGSAFFEFDAGQTPQVGQTWAIDQTLHLSGTDVRMISATMVEKDLAVWGLSTNTQGFEFSFEAVDGRTPFLLDIMDRDMDHITNGMIMPFSDNSEPSTTFTTSLFYEKGVPTGKISVAVNVQTTMLSGNWKLQWNSPDQAGTTLLDSAQSLSSMQGTPSVTASLERVVKLNEGYLFYIHMTTPDQRPDFRVTEPDEVSVIDSTGRKISLQLNGPQVYNATNENLWEFGTKEKIADGPIKLIIEKAKVHYNAWGFDPPPTREIIQSHSFTFDVGPDPQIDQVWSLDTEFELGGHKGTVTSVRAVSIDPQLLPFPELRSDESINRGYEFTVQSADPTIQWNVLMFLNKPEGSTDPGFVDCIGYLEGNVSSTTTHTVTCRGLPNQTLEASIYEISVLVNNVWEMDWILPVQ